MIAAVLFLLWLLGVVSSYTMRGFVHVILAIAVFVILAQVFTKRRSVAGHRLRYENDRGC